MERTWRWVSLEDARPLRLAPEPRVRSRLRDWWERFRGGTADEMDVAPDEARLAPVEARRLDALTPAAPLEAQRAALSTLRGRRTRSVLLRPDDGSWDGALDERSEVGPVHLPPPDAPPMGDTLASSVRSLLGGREWLHVSHLERWWVRHEDGLGAVRELVHALTEREGPWTLDVAPWAWGLMRRVLPEMRGLPAALAPAPLDGEALAAWFDPKGAVRLREGGEAPDLSTFRALARRARGEAGIARGIWRACLLGGAEEGPPETEAGEGEGAGDGEGSNGRRDGVGAPTIWMHAPQRVELPSAASLARDDLLYLHAILIHGGATPQVLAWASGLSPAEVRTARLVCEARELVHTGEDGRTRVRSTALASVRDRLVDEGFVAEAP